MGHVGGRWAYSLCTPSTGNCPSWASGGGLDVGAECDFRTRPTFGGYIRYRGGDGSRGGGDGPIGG
eukprot:4960558-Prymnesium_polylepis.1